MMLILTGVSGCGKSTIGQLLANELDLPFYDADDFHPRANVEKMQSGQPLNDADRQPWLETLAEHISDWSAKSGAVLACSALKEVYRETLASKCDSIQWIHLKGSFELIKSRLEARKGHFMDSNLLQSQFDTLEIADYGLHIDISPKAAEIVENILEKMKKSFFGLIGLGVMGKSLSLNIAEKGFTLSVYNRASEGEEHIVQDFLSDNSNFQNIQGFTDLAAFINSLERPRKIFLMIKAGAVVDAVLSQLVPLLSEGDVVMDGGNSHYQDTKRRFEMLAKKGIHFMGVGVSGGEAGARHGASIMPGGTRESYKKVAPVLEAIAAKDKAAKPCCTYIGPEGAGHFIKMVHNGIEYVEMQLLAELYAMLKPRFSYEAIADLFDTWNQGDLSSYLLEITANILRKKEGDAYLLDLILDKAGNKGTGSWSSKAALELGTVNSMMASAVFARYVSSFKTLRGKMAHSESEYVSKIELSTLENAYRTARILNHQQGFALMQAASEQHNWKLNFSEIARIWTNGCIIRSTFMEEVIELFKSQNALFEAASILKKLKTGEQDLSEIIREATLQRVPTPSFYTAYNYWVSVSTNRLSANLIQAQRDYFGAHRYQRVDRDWSETFHTDW